MAQRGGTVALDQSDQQLALRGLQAARLQARHPGALLEHELHRARSRDREGHRTLVRGRARAARPRSARSLADGAADDAPPRGSRRRWLQPEPSLGGGRDRLERARPLPLLLRPPLRATSLQRLPRDDEEDGRGHRARHLPDRASLRTLPGVTTVTSSTTRRSSARARRATASPSSRSAGRGYIPWLGRALLCAEPPLAAGSAPAKSRIAFVSAPGPGPRAALRRERRRERAGMADAYRRGRSSGCLVSRRAEDCFREYARRQLRGLRHERGRERAAEADARPGAGFSSGVVTRRAEDRLRTPACRGLRRLPREPRRGRAAEADAQRGTVLRSCLVARRTEDRLPEQARRQLGDLRHECRRQRAAQPDAGSGRRQYLCLVARRAEDRLHEQARRHLGHPPDECRRQRAAEPDARPGVRLLLLPGHPTDGRSPSVATARSTS